MLRRDCAIDISRYVSGCEDFNLISVLSLIFASKPSMPFLLTNSRRAFPFTKIHCNTQWQCICQGEIVKFSDYQKTELGKEVEVKSNQIKPSTRSPPPPAATNHHLHQITSSNKSPAHILHLEVAWLQVDSTFPDSPPPPASAAPWFGRGAGSLPHLNRPCLVHNLEHGLVHNGAASHACPTHGHRGHGGVGPPPPPPANGCLPGQNSKYSNFSPERVIWD